jgi:transcriptional regulator with XRE-family HTH domain
MPSWKFIQIRIKRKVYHMKPAAMMKNRKLRTERKLHGWSQARLAEVLGVTTRTVIRWEQGLAVPQPNYRKKLGTLFGKTAQELGLLWDTDEATAVQEVCPPTLRLVTSDFAVPASSESLVADPSTPQNLGSINRLIGRTSLLMQIKQRLLDADNLTFTALYGSPSVGKTTLAVALTMDQDIQARFPDGILWAPLGPQPHVLGQLMRWGILLGVAPSDVSNPESQLAWSQALRSVMGNRQMLLVIDDAWTTQDALTLQIGGAECTYLLTTRQPQVAFTVAERRSIIVPPLEEADGLVLLTHFVPQLVQQDPEGARSLIQVLGSLPLALILMGNYLASPTLTQQPWALRGALAQLHDTQEHLRVSMLTSSEESRPHPVETAPLSLYAAITICAQQLNPQALAALDALAIFPPKPQSFSEEAALAMSRQSRETLDELCNAGLLENLGPSRYCLHPTVADYARARAKSQWSKGD